MKCIIVDDDDVSRMSIEKCVERHPEIDCKGSFSSGKDGLDFLKENSCDLVLLDIEMPKMTGLDFMALLDAKTHVVVVSSKSEYALDAYNFDVADYLTKPIDFERFCKAVSKVKNIQKDVKIDDSSFDNLFIKSDSKYVKISLDDIQHIEALSDYVSIFSDKGRFVVLGTMKSMEAKLDTKKFVRIHRSYIVNINRISTIQDGYVMIGDSKLPISRGSKENLMKQINLLN